MLGDVMQRIPVLIVSLFLLCCMTLSGCGNKTQAVDEDSQDDLFVEYHEYYFPEKIETLALGELAGYRGRLESPFPARKNAKQRRASRHYGTIALPSNLPETRRQLLRAAESAIGTPYVFGGMAPGGFDCSGLVCWAYGNVGVRLPRTAREQSVVGSRVGRLEDMQAGDIVTFRHPKRGYHSGIYVGNGKFIHSPRKRSHVKINSLDDPYFRNTFLSARRIQIGSRENLLAQAERRLVQDAGTLPSVALHREDSRTSRNASRYKRASLSRLKQERERSDRKITVAEYRERKSSSESRRKDLREERSRKRDREDIREERSRKRNREDIREERSRKRDREDLRAERSRKRDRDDLRKESRSKRESRDVKKESRHKGESVGRSRKEDHPSGKRSRDEKKSKKK